MANVTIFESNRNAGNVVSRAQFSGAETDTDFEVLSDASIPIQVFHGKDFTYSNDFVAAGTIDTITFFNNAGQVTEQQTDLDLQATDYRRLLSIGDTNYDYYQFLYRGNDKVIGSRGDDSIMGSDGKDRIDGGKGSDILTFLGYDEAVRVDLTKNVAVTSTGTSTLKSIEDAAGTAFADTLVGSKGDNQLQGFAGDDIVKGGKGFDTALYSDATSAVQVNLGTGDVTGGSGHDTISSIERIIGSRFADVLTGSKADESFLGGLGDDTIDGGRGSDTVEYGFVGSAVAVNLDSGRSSGAAGKDQLTSIENVSGSVFDDTITGGDGANRLDGGNGDDKIIGGKGADILIGGDGADRFVFADAGDSGTGKTTRDQILDFHHGEDRIDLKSIDANGIAAGDQKFSFIGTDAFDRHAGELRFETSGSSVILMGDVNGDGKADFHIALADLKAIVAADFIL